MALLSKSQSAGIRVRVCMAYVGGLAPRKGGGVASATSGIVKRTAGEVDYLLLTVYIKLSRKTFRNSTFQAFRPSTLGPVAIFLQM